MTTYDGVTTHPEFGPNRALPGARLTRNHDGDLLLVDGECTTLVARCFTPLWWAIVQPCRVDQFSSRTCERGTNGCAVLHDAHVDAQWVETPQGVDVADRAWALSIADNHANPAAGYAVHAEHIERMRRCPLGCFEYGQCKANMHGVPSECPARTDGVKAPLALWPEAQAARGGPSPAVRSATAIFHITRALVLLENGAIKGRVLRDHLNAARDALRATALGVKENGNGNAS